MAKRRRITSYRLTGHRMGSEILSCGHPGHRGLLKTLLKRMDLGKSRLCKSCDTESHTERRI